VLIKRSERHRVRGGVAAAQVANSSSDPDRRTFLKRSGVAAGALAALGNLPLGGLRKAEAGPPPPAGATVNRHALDTAGKIERPGNRIRISCVHPPVSCGASAWRCTVTGAS
jgi:hypothetical protein